MTHSEISIKLEQIMRIVFDDASIVIRDDLSAADVESWDSLNHINLIVAIEKKFGIRFTTREVYAADTVGEFIDMLEKKINTDASSH